MRCHFIPGYLLDRIVEASDENVAEGGRRTALIDHRLFAARTAIPPLRIHGPAWQVHDADNGTALPGELVRSPGDPEVKDVAVNEAAIGIARSLELFADLGRSSFDGAGASVLATVHYEKDYANAFWDGNQLVFGDGDGKVFGRFTGPIDVLGHELAHAVTQYAADLTYRGQSGALNESLSDVFGSCLKQRHLGQDAAIADWLIGEGIFLPGVNGGALRSMVEPGTAYDDPVLGKDPQVGSMADFVETSEDNGGVHLNSGIPNRAFVLAATAVGGESWAGAGRIWYAALVSGLDQDSDFATFAAATVAAAGEHASAVEDAWRQVGVGAEGEPATKHAGPSETAPRRIEVTRSGGFAGMTRQGAVDLASDDPRVPEARDLVQQIDFDTIECGEPAPDRFVYQLRYSSSRVLVHEPALTPDLQRLVGLVLDD